MNFEVGYRGDEWSFSSDSPEILKNLIGIVEDGAKSKLHNGHHEEARDALNVLIALKKAYGEIKNEHPGPEKS